MVYLSFTHLRCYTKILELDFGLQYIGYMNFNFLEFEFMDFEFLNFAHYNGDFFTSGESMGF